jgi:hypothetical protein
VVACLHVLTWLQQHTNRPIDPITTSAMLALRPGHQDGAILPPSMQIDPSVVIAIKPTHSKIDARMAPYTHGLNPSNTSVVSATSTTVWVGTFVILSTTNSY